MRRSWSALLHHDGPVSIILVVGFGIFLFVTISSRVLLVGNILGVLGGHAVAANAALAADLLPRVALLLLHAKEECSKGDEGSCNDGTGTAPHAANHDDGSKMPGRERSNSSKKFYFRKLPDKI